MVKIVISLLISFLILIYTYDIPNAVWLSTDQHAKSCTNISHLCFPDTYPVLLPIEYGKTVEKMDLVEALISETLSPLSSGVFCLWDEGYILG
jgi:hypothetical protein